MIKDLKSMAAGTIVKGFPLLIKTARKMFTDPNGETWQEVVFMDASGEMLGHISMEGNVPWQSKTNLCIMTGEIQDTDERKKEGTKLIVTDCFDTVAPFTFDQKQDMQEEDWKHLREEEIKGKIRHGLCCAFIQSNTGNPLNQKDQINEITDFIMKGE